MGALRQSIGSDREIITELVGHVPELLKSPHGNFVLQKIIEDLPPSMSAFIPNELCGGVSTARHQFGCRIISRLIEHSLELPTVQCLLEEILPRAAVLCRHKYAQHVIQAVLEYGAPEQRHTIAVALMEDAVCNAKDRNASFVIERALRCCSEHDREALATILLCNLDSVIELAGSRSGRGVLRGLMNLSRNWSLQVQRKLADALPTLTQNEYGNPLLQELGLICTAYDDNRARTI